MASAPTLSAAQWKLIENELPARRRDRAAISALLYRSSSGQSLRDVSAAYDVSRSKLAEWEAVLTVDGTLQRVMQKLGLDAAGWLAWRRGGQAWTRRQHNHAGVTELRLADFGRALRGTR